MAAEWVAIMTFSDEYGGMFYEAGGGYDHEPHCRGMRGARELTPDEHVATCPRCGQRFAATSDGTAESHRDLHFDGDEDIPSICRNLPTRRPVVLRRMLTTDERRQVLADHYRVEWRSDRTIPDDVATLLAEHAGPDADARELQGLLIRVIAYASLTSQDVSVDVAREVLAGLEGGAGQ